MMRKSGMETVLGVAAAVILSPSKIMDIRLGEFITIHFFASAAFIWMQLETHTNAVVLEIMSVFASVCESEGLFFLQHFRHIELHS